MAPSDHLKWGLIPTKRIVNDNHVQKVRENSFKTDYDVTTCPEEIDQIGTVQEINKGTKKQWQTLFHENESDSTKNTQDFSYFSLTPEKKLLLKLDMLLTFYACLSTWIKMLTVNMNNAYVSGMKEELHFVGNDLVHIQSLYTAGNIAFQLPFLFLPRMPLNFVLPALEICWGLLTIGTGKSTSVYQIKILRFFTGAFEAPSYIAYMYLFGSFFKSDEIARRSGFMIIGQYAGFMSTGAIQSAIYGSLNNSHGLSGWRWYFIIVGAVSMFVALLGFYSLPGDIHNCYSIFLTEDEIRLMLSRVLDAQSKISDTSDRFFDRSLLKKILRSWKLYVLVIWNVFAWNSSNSSHGGFQLWLQSLKKYSIPRLNNLTMISPGVGLIYIFFGSIIADKLHCRWGVIVFFQILNLTGNVLLAVWNIAEGAKWFAFVLQYTAFATLPLVNSWQSEICSDNQQERSIILVSMNMAAQSSIAWISNLVWKTQEAPQFFKGYVWAAVSSFTMMGFTIIILFLTKHDTKQKYIT